MWQLLTREGSVININFSDFWVGFVKEDNYFYNLLSNHFDVKISDDPDLLIFSCYGKDYLKYKCVRIFYASENQRIDFSCCDYGIGFDYLKRQNYFRLPLYVYYLNGNVEAFVKNDLDVRKILLEKTEFCNMIVSNPNSERRIKFFQKLSKYKKVDSGGRYLNNIGQPVQNKMNFIRKYKFTFAFENSAYPGYTTEKIMEPMLSYSIPIYWGNPLIHREFNPKSFVNSNDYANDDELIERIIELDVNEDKYLECLKEPYVYNNNIDNLDFSQSKFVAYLDKIISNVGNFTPIALTNMRFIHEYKRKYLVLSHEIKRRFRIKRFR